MANSALLIVNADDFGLAKGVNQAVARAFDCGILRSASLLAGAAFAEQAANIAKERPGLGIGVHLALTQMAPVLPAERVPGLTAGRETMSSGPSEFVRHLVGGKIPSREIVQEFSAQIEKVLNWGISITHLDSHQHLHLLPRVREAFLEVARKYSIRRMRMPNLNGPRRSLPAWLKALAISGAAQLSRSVFSEMQRPARFWGLAASGDLKRADLLYILDRLKTGTHELMTHPAAYDSSMRQALDRGYQWEAELEALCDPEVLASVNSKGIRLGNYSDLD